MLGTNVLWYISMYVIISRLFYHIVTKQNTTCQLGPNLHVAMQDNALDIVAPYIKRPSERNLTHWGRDKWTPFRRLKCVFLNENVWIPFQISLKFLPKGPINNIPALVQIMAWRRPGDKPLSEPMMIRLPTHICVTRPQWVKGFFLCYI